MFVERDLVRLIIQLNPYAIPPAMTFAPPSDAVLAAQNAAVEAATTVANLEERVPANLSAFIFQRQDNPAYQMNWTWEFNGQQRIIRRALRIQYHYPVFNGGGAVATEHVLIGYEGGGGP
jgi:hypothetical protein